MGEEFAKEFGMDSLFSFLFLVIRLLALYVYSRILAVVPEIESTP